MMNRKRTTRREVTRKWAGKIEEEKGGEASYERKEGTESDDRRKETFLIT
jgi:hypothetical protein